MDEETHGDGWTKELQQWVSLPANVPTISTYSTTLLEFNDPLKAYSNEFFGRGSSHSSDWFPEPTPVHPIKEENHQLDSEQPLENPSEVSSSLLVNTEGRRSSPFPLLSQRSHLLSCDNSQSRKPSPDSSSSSFQPKRSEKRITSYVAPLKVRKEKLGDRITTLQQLVSPFGKTDTASVLLDAIEYIKYLHEQLTVLCAQYVKMSYEIKNEMGGKEDLRSRGLCLVPISIIGNVGKDTSSNSWAPMSGTSYQ